MVAVVVGVPVVVLSIGAAVPLAATPEPLTVAAFTVVEPAAFTIPEPLLVALTVVEPDALVIAVCAIAELPNVRPRSAALTAAATVLFCCSLLVVMTLLSIGRGTVQNVQPKHAPDAIGAPVVPSGRMNVRDDGRC